MLTDEFHICYWLRTEWGQMGSWDEAVDRLISPAYALQPCRADAAYQASILWLLGYQPLAMFAPTARLGPPEAFARFVDPCHGAGIGVILDWVPAHFPSDDHSLARFVRSALYQHEDPRQGFHIAWNTLIYNVGRREVRGFLIASALFWLETFYLNGQPSPRCTTEIAFAGRANGCPIISARPGLVLIRLRHRSKECPAA